MAIQSSFPRVADQVLSFNKNVVEILSKINSITQTAENSTTINITDETGTLRSFTLPSFT